MFTTGKFLTILERKTISSRRDRIVFEAKISVYIKLNVPGRGAVVFPAKTFVWRMVMNGRLNRWCEIKQIRQIQIYWKREGWNRWFATRFWWCIKGDFVILVKYFYQFYGRVVPMLPLLEPWTFTYICRAFWNFVAGHHETRDYKDGILWAFSWRCSHSYFKTSSASMLVLTGSSGLLKMEWAFCIPNAGDYRAAKRKSWTDLWIHQLPKKLWMRYAKLSITAKAVK